MTDVFETYKPYHFTNITEGNIRMEDIFQVCIYPESEESCILAHDMLSSVLHTDLIIKKLMRGDYDQEEI